MYIHVFNSLRYPRVYYHDAYRPPVTIREVTDNDGVSVLSVVPVDVSVPVLCSDVDLKAKLMCGAPLNPVSSIQHHSLNIADSAQSFLNKKH